MQQLNFNEVRCTELVEEYNSLVPVAQELQTKYAATPVFEVAEELDTLQRKLVNLQASIQKLQRYM